MSGIHHHWTCQAHDLILDSGQSLPTIDIAYETCGELSKTKDNVILICHALSGDANVVESIQNGEPIPGWWDGFVGPQCPIDTNRYFVICTNVLGGCKGSTGPGSICPSTGKPYGLDFPVITIRDMVRVQAQLIRHLGISEIQLVIGGSMGGMQALEWAITFPDMVKACVSIAAAGRLSPQALAFDAVGRYAITSDPAWHGGNYGADGPESGLAVARMIGHITYLSDESMNSKFGRRLQVIDDYGYAFNSEFQVESYLEHQGNKFVERFDANSYLYLTKAISYFDLDKTYGSLSQAFATTHAQFLIVSIESDWLYPPKQSQAIANTLMRLNKPVTYCEIDSDCGHDAFLVDFDKLGNIVQSFLRKISL